MTIAAEILNNILYRYDNALMWLIFMAGVALVIKGC